MSSSANSLSEIAASVPVIKKYFLQEETILFQTHQPHVFTHQAEHRELIVDFAALIGELAQGQASAANSIRDLLLDRFIKDHILGADMNHVGSVMHHPSSTSFFSDLTVKRL